MWRDQGFLLRNDGAERPALQWLKSYVTGKTPNPFVEITGPDKSKLYWEGETITLTAEAADGDGTVTQVEFFNHGVPIGIISDGNYQLTLTDIEAGTYSFSAIATDSNDLTYKSGLHVISVLSADDIIPLEDGFVRSDNPI
jgi:chitinase